MFQLPRTTKYLLVINIIAYLMLSVVDILTERSASPVDLNDAFGLHFFLAPDFRFYQLVTYMFMHGSFMHLFFNMFALWMFGCVVENVLGARRFLFYYIACGIGAGLFQETAQFFEFLMLCNEQIPGFAMSDVLLAAQANAQFINHWATVGASGAVYAILLAFGMIFPEQRIFIFPLPIPIKAKWFVIMYAAIELFSALNSPGDGVAHVAHLGGMLFGFFLIRYWRRHPGAGHGSYGGSTFFDKMRRNADNWKRERTFGGNRRNGGGRSAASNPDWDYNVGAKKKQEEIDHILDKIRKSGYDSLTEEEKMKLFDGGKGGVN
jgi:membrane associated rhomboid family serine protease